MAARTKRLNARTVETLTKPGRHADGGNLYLNVTATGAKSWIFLYRFGGRQREMGLGPALDVPLAKAREMAQRCRQGLLEGIDPITARKAMSTVPTFGALALEFIETMRSQWKNPKHPGQWRNSLVAYAAPIWDAPVDKIGTDDVLACLKPIWLAKPETAKRVLGRMAAVFDAAKARKLRAGENPAAWVGNLKNLLPARPALSRGHFAAMAIDDMPAFMARLRARPAISARALELTILTASRTGETLGASWSELDLDKGLWIIPALRMKAGREHRVPLSADALAVLRPLHAARTGDLVFPGLKPGKPLSNMAMDKVLRLEKLEVTVHGFRSTFRDWASERTGFPADVCEAALAHMIGNKVEAAYRRGDLFDKRRALMEAWASFCGAAEGGKVVPISSGGRR